MAAPSTVSAWAARGRCSRANGPTTRSPPVTSTKLDACSRRSKRAPTTAASCPSRYGTRRIFLSASCFTGGPTGSAMPLVWAHAEHLKLVRSLHDGRVFDMPAQTWQRYVIEHTRSRHAFWRFNHKLQRMDPGPDAADRNARAMPRALECGWMVHPTTRRHATRALRHVVDLPTESLPIGTTIAFTFYWPDVNRWEQSNFQVVIASTEPTVKAQVRP